MATNRKLKTDLLKKIDITEQALNLRAQQRKQELPMSTEQAYYTFAHEAGLDLSKYLPAETVAEVRALMRDLKAAGASPGTNGRQQKKATSTTPKKTVVTIAGMKESTLPGLTAKHAAEAKQMAESVYPMLYLFENSLRDLIVGILESAHGSDWWTKSVHAKIQAKAADRKSQEKNDPWHGRRGARPIDYVDLRDLWLIIKGNWRWFKDVFPSGPAWVESLITNDMNVSRRPLAHMNPLSADDIESVKNAFKKWTKLLKAVEDKLP